VVDTACTGAAQAVRSMVSTAWAAAASGVPPVGHRGGAGVVGPAVECHQQPLDPGDRGDHAQRHALALQHGPLLDVQLQVACTLPGRQANRSAPSGSAPNFASTSPIPPPLGVPPVQVLAGEHPGQRPAAQAADAERVRLLARKSIT